jgi:hypothetical protein
MRLWIDRSLPDYTTLITAAKSSRHEYARLKRSWEQGIAIRCAHQRFKPSGTCWTYLFIERDRRRDPSNVLLGGVKLIEDALRGDDKRGRGPLRNDGWAHVTAIRPYFTIGTKNPGVMVWATESPLTENEALEQATEVISGRKRNPSGRDIFPELRENEE